VNWLTLINLFLVLYIAEFLGSKNDLPAHIENNDITYIFLTDVSMMILFHIKQQNSISRKLIKRKINKQSFA